MMKTRTRIWVPRDHFRQVNKDLKAFGVKFYPFSKYGRGYEIEFEPANHPLVTLLLLKYEGLTVEDVYVTIDNKEI